MKKKHTLLELLINEKRNEETAKGLILSGRVFVDGNKETRPGISPGEDASIEIRGDRQYPSRAAYKLLGAFEENPAAVKGKICLDLGASHGGFAKVLLEKGAKKIFCIDVAYGILDYGIRTDNRVEVLERKNAKEISSDWFQKKDMDEMKSEGIFAVCDISFMSLKTVLSSLMDFLNSEGISDAEGFFLLKPQFEDSAATEKGILKDENRRNEILTNMVSFAEQLGFRCISSVPASIRGTEGNQEYVLYLKLSS